MNILVDVILINNEKHEIKYDGSSKEFLDAFRFNAENILLQTTSGSYVVGKHIASFTIKETRRS